MKLWLRKNWYRLFVCSWRGHKAGIAFGRFDDYRCYYCRKPLV